MSCQNMNMFFLWYKVLMQNVHITSTTLKEYGIPLKYCHYWYRWFQDGPFSKVLSGQCFQPHFGARKSRAVATRLAGP